MSLRTEALRVLQICEPALKASQARQLPSLEGALQVGSEDDIPEPEGLPGRPEQPRLVPPKEVATRSPQTLDGRRALLHALCHIEFNAINLALDAVWRFHGMPDTFYRDWIQVAAEEALHFELLSAHLESLGARYGDFAAHDGLWSMAHKTRHDRLARMALVPRTLEARGLDATPPLQAKFSRAGDQRAVEILTIILRDEIGHVAIGNHWYGWLCARQSLDPVAHYPVLTVKYGAPRLRAPFNLEAREAAGFTREELHALQQP